MSKTHILGLPRIGGKRELKFALEAFWRGEIDESSLRSVGRSLRAEGWALQDQAGLDLITIGDFSYYDHVLDTQIALGALPTRFAHQTKTLTLAQSFDFPRGRQDQKALEMTKWFDTNYHYLVPEWDASTPWDGNGEGLFQEIQEALDLGYETDRLKVVLLGPLTLWALAKWTGPGTKDQAWEPLIQAYSRILSSLKSLGIPWVQIDEPVLVLDRGQNWEGALSKVYAKLLPLSPQVLLTTYFEGVSHRLEDLLPLGFSGIHLDLVRCPEQLESWDRAWPKDKVLSVGIINGRNVWKLDQTAWSRTLGPIVERRGANLWLAPSCSLIHVPYDLENESTLKIKNTLAFAVQKVGELGQLRSRLNHPTSLDKDLFQPVYSLGKVPEDDYYRSEPYQVRAQVQKKVLGLPLWPTTTIGSFPQTPELRKLRSDFKKGLITEDQVTATLKAEILNNVRWQEEVGLDVLVHGEPERVDMVEYFGTQLEGYTFTENAWVQSYGSRCVKPPIIYADVSRPGPITVQWILYAQSLTAKPMKAMLTGPITMVQWAFVREDIPRSEVVLQVARALKEEVADLQSGGIKIIQVDEAAFREGLPLRTAAHEAYWDLAARAFRLAVSPALAQTQIHTHMCYSDFRSCLPQIAAMDADVITIENARSDRDIWESFKNFSYKAEVGPGVWDIHSPVVPQVGAMVTLMKQAAQNIDSSRLWVNPDCGLKTRAWPEVKEGIRRMVEAARVMRT